MGDHTTNHYVCISSDAVYRYKSRKESTKEYTKINGVNPFNYKSDLYNGPLKNVKSIRLVEYFINFPSEYRPFANDDSLETLEDLLDDKHNTIETVLEKYKEGQITNNTAVNWLVHKIEQSQTQLQINLYKTILENLTTIQESYRSVTDTDDQYRALFTPNYQTAYLSFDSGKGWSVSTTTRSTKVPVTLDPDPIVPDNPFTFEKLPDGTVGEVINFSMQIIENGELSYVNLGSFINPATAQNSNTPLFSSTDHQMYLKYDEDKTQLTISTDNTTFVSSPNLDFGLWNFDTQPTGQVGEDISMFNSSGFRFTIENPPYARNRIYTNVADKFPCFVLRVNNINNGYIFNDTPNIFEIIPYYKQNGSGYKMHTFTESFGAVIKSIHIHIVDQHGDELPKSLSSAGGANWWMFEIQTLDVSDMSR